MCKGTLRSINDYFAHEEQTLLYLVSSEELEEREVGVRHILRIRREKADALPCVKKRRWLRLLNLLGRIHPSP